MASLTTSAIDIGICSAEVLKLVQKVQLSPKTYKKFNQVLKLVKLVQLSPKVNTVKKVNGNC